MKKIHAKRVRRQTICIEFVKFLKMMGIYGSYRYFFAKNIDKALSQNHKFHYFEGNPVHLTVVYKDRNCKRSILKEFYYELQYHDKLYKEIIDTIFFRLVKIYDNGKCNNISKIKLYEELFWLYLCDKGYNMSILID
jgi:hypothetical protein